MDWFLGRKLGLPAHRQPRVVAQQDAGADAGSSGARGASCRWSGRGLTPDQFRRGSFLTGKPVVLGGIASEWRREVVDVRVLLERCSQDDIDVLDGHNWKVQATPGADAVEASGARHEDEGAAERTARSGWCMGPSWSCSTACDDMRADIDWNFVRDYGSTSMRLPWQRNILARRYASAGPLTSTSFHCAPVMNLYLQVYGRKRWVLVAPKFTPFMCRRSRRGLNWQSRAWTSARPNYRGRRSIAYVDRYETVLGARRCAVEPALGVARRAEPDRVRSRSSMWWANVIRTASNSPVLTPLAFLGRPNPVLLQLGLEEEPAREALRVQRAPEQVIDDNQPP